jgi:hypothetical protein
MDSSFTNLSTTSENTLNTTTTTTTTVNNPSGAMNISATCSIDSNKNLKHFKKSMIVEYESHVVAEDSQSSNHSSSSNSTSSSQSNGTSNSSHSYHSASNSLTFDNFKDSTSKKRKKEQKTSKSKSNNKKLNPIEDKKDSKVPTTTSTTTTTTTPPTATTTTTTKKRKRLSNEVVGLLPYNYVESDGSDENANLYDKIKKASKNQSMNNSTLNRFDSNKQNSNNNKKMNKQQQNSNINKKREVYCICKSYDSSRFMIACDECDEWYHGDCVGVTQSLSNKIKVFYCHLCREKNSGLSIKFKKKFNKLRKINKIITNRNKLSTNNNDEQQQQQPNSKLFLKFQKENRVNLILNSDN